MFGSNNDAIARLEQRISDLNGMVMAMSPLLKTAYIRAHVLQGCVGALVGEIAGRVSDPETEIVAILNRLRESMAKLEFEDADGLSVVETEGVFAIVRENAKAYISVR